MSWLKNFGKGIVGAGVGVVCITALPVFGAVGAITAAGAAVGVAAGSIVGMAVDDDHLAVMATAAARTHMETIANKAR